MAFQTVPYTNELKSEVSRFNSRLKGGGITTFFPEQATSWLPKRDGLRIYEEYFLAIEDFVVRGGYILKTQDFYLQGETVPVSCYRYPVSEGTINKNYNLIAVQLLTHALKKNPLIFSLGMGGFHYPLPKIQRALGWYLEAVPFFFRVCHPFAFLKNIPLLRKSLWRRKFADFLALSGIGPLGIRTLQFLSIKRDDCNGSVEVIGNFSQWVDQIWQDAKDVYPMIAVRDSETLNRLYPTTDKRFIRLKVTHGGRTVGWAVCLDTQMSAHNHFGNMRVGSIIDCMAPPEGSLTVIQAARKYLENRNVDLIVSNQSHRTWGEALKKSGFLQGPSNFIFAASKPLLQRLQGKTVLDIHLNRGDCDGPINL